MTKDVEKKLLERNEKLHQRVSELISRIDHCEDEHSHAYQIEEHNVGLRIALHDVIDIAERHIADKPLRKVEADYVRLKDIRKWAGAKPIVDDDDD